DSLKSSESARAQGVWSKRFKGPPEDAKAMAKQVRFLAARGFDAAAIRAAVPPIAYSAAGVSAADDESEPALNIDDLFMDDGATP
ncbi:MAG: RecX family transcriptional regulator, partial [Burkholderiaceae bacterium]|nr:RecX family transcriptional regulator [Burkholderiaceae bacterium]